MPASSSYQVGTNGIQPNPWSIVQTTVTLEEIDEVLHRIASGCRFSSPLVRASEPPSSSANQLLGLGDLYTRLSARDAKWLTRLVLKNYQPVVLDPLTVYRACHPLLLVILKVQDDFSIAARFLQNYHRSKGVTGEVLDRNELACRLKPTLGVKVGRQMWLKGRSIKHCLDMSHGRMSCEEKVDGEYCQIHIDLSKGRDCIQIFSKSGKDSTRDRAGLHEAIRTSLQIGQPSCPLKHGCILEGELVVYSDRDDKILDFHKIRKHVSRSGAFLGTDKDSQPHSWEHLMIVYFDALMIDDQSLLGVKQSERFKRLGQLVACKTGRSALVRRQIIDCNERDAASNLRRAFAKCITARAEGLVLKADDPYFDFSTSRRPYGCSCIKLKKEYVGSFGDVGDFAVVGARYDAVAAKTLGIPNLKWTHFFIGCLENKEEVQRWGRIPRFTVTNVVELNASQMRLFISHVNPRSVPESENDAISLRVAPGIDNGKRPSVIFTEPPVFDIRCFSFEKGGNTGFWSLRFPMVNKVHCDRTYRETISFAELQDMAKSEKEMPPPEDSQELLGFIAALEQADPGGVPVDAMSSQLTASTTSTVMTPSSFHSSGPRHVETMTLPSIIENHPTSKLPASRPSAHPSVAEPLTPPVSSAAKPVDMEKDVAKSTPNNPQISPRLRKRPSEPSHSPRQLKAQKRVPGPRLTSSNPREKSYPQRTTPPGSSRSHRRAREPLADITTSSQPCENTTSPQVTRLAGVHSFYAPSTENQPPSSSFLGHASSAPVSFCAAPGPRPRSPSVEIPDSQSSNQASASASTSTATIRSANFDGPTECVYCPDTCALTGISFLLAPCVSQTPWLTEDLLSSHGVGDFVLDPNDWKNAAFPPSTAETLLPGGSAAATRNGNPQQLPGRRKPRLKKVVLVESRRKDATDAFLRRIERAGLELRRGRREYVPVFDWRLLEALTTGEAECSRNGDKQDARFDMKSSQSIWRKYWIGLA